MDTGSSDQANQENGTSHKTSAGKEIRNMPRPPLCTPQAATAAVWTKFMPKHPGKVTQILPQNQHNILRATVQSHESSSAHLLSESFELAKERCEAQVAKIVKECKRCNMRYRDTHFDIENDLKENDGADCLYTLFHDFGPRDEENRPRAVKRVYQIFDKPEFFIDGATPPDIRQGTSDNCWVLAALGSLGGAKGKELIEKICVAKDEQVGVYGFVFHRDGTWIHTVIDDKLYLTHSDFDESRAEKKEWMRSKFRNDPEEEYRKAYLVGSRALYFANCTRDDETWLPLLEKAFAKIHGDYESLDAGFSGEAMEDLTGGVTTELLTSDILDTKAFWQELLLVNDRYLFGCSTGRFDTWQGGKGSDRKGIQASHAYSIIEAREFTNPNNGKFERLLKIRNPWGRTEWTGAWSDGHELWTDATKKLLNHQSADDGIFWIRYEDWLKKFHYLDRTRLFDDSWYITQRWTSLQVPWSAVDYHATKFTFTLGEESPVVIVLSQLDNRYWRGLEGQYKYSLHFQVRQSGQHDYMVCSHGNYFMRRSVSTELTLRPGEYEVHIKVTAIRDKDKPSIDKVLVENIEERQAKLMKTAFSYDSAHAKGPVLRNEADKRHMAGYIDEMARAEAIVVAKSLKYKAHIIRKKRHDRKKRREERKEARHMRKSGQEERESLNGGAVLQIPVKTELSGVGKRKSKRRGKAISGTPESLDTRDFQASSISQRTGQNPRSRLLSAAKMVDDNSSGFYSNNNGKRSDYQSTMSNTSEPSHTPLTSGNISDSVSSYNSSVDSDLDSDYFPHKHDHKNHDSKQPDRSRGNLDTQLAELAAEPWNAVCVVGLRIFTQTDTTKLDTKSEYPNMIEGMGEQGYEPINSGFSVDGDRTGIASWVLQQTETLMPPDNDDRMRGLRHMH